MAGLKRTLTALTMLAVAGGLGAAAYNQRMDVDPARATAAAPPEGAAGVVELAEIEISKVERRNIVEDARLSGTIQPALTTTLNAEVSGTLEDLPFQIGEPVKAGDVVAQLNTDELESLAAAQQASLEAQRAQLSLAEAVLERNRQLGQSGIASEAALLEAEANVLNLRALVRGLEVQLDDARREIEDATVRAPFDGVVATRPVEVGQTVAANTELMTIVDLSRIEVNAAVPTSRIAEVRPGQIATFRVEGFPDREFTAEVVRISPIAEPGSRSVRVFLTIDNQEGRLRGGMFATGILQIREFPDVIALPRSAIRRDEGGEFVLKAENGRLKRQAVDVGEVWTERDLVEVAGGLDEGEIVVTAPLPDLQPDVEVRIAEL